MKTPVLLTLIVSSLLIGCAEDGDSDTTTSTRQAATTVTADGPETEEAGAPAAQASNVPELVDRVHPSIVTITARGSQGDGEGSGVIWDSDGTIVTNFHVVEGAQDVGVALASGERLDAEIRATDPLTDLAVLEVDADDLPAARFADELPQVGEPVLAVGNPLGFEGTVTSGIVSGLHRAIPSGGTTPALVDLIQTDAAISPGNSGGALVDHNGRVVGVNVAYLPQAGGAVSIGFAIPSPTVTDVVEELLQDGRAEHSYLGVSLTQLTPEIAERFDVAARTGAIVGTVEAGSPADRAGVEPSDVITTIAGREVQTVEDVFSALRRKAPGETVTFEVLRGGRTQQLEAKLSRRR